MSLKIYTILRLGTEKIVDSDLLNSIEEKSNLIRENYGFEGYLILESDENPRIEIDDDIEANIINLCLKATIELIQEHSAIVDYFSMPGQIYLKADEDFVYFNGSTFYRDEYINQMIDCAKRFIQLMEKVIPKTRYKHTIDFFIPFLEEAENLNS